MLVSEEQKHFSPLETKLHFHLNSPNYVNCIVLKARALTFFKILDGVDQATIQIRHHRMLSLACSQAVFFIIFWMINAGKHLSKERKSQRLYKR